MRHLRAGTIGVTACVTLALAACGSSGSSQGSGGSGGPIKLMVMGQLQATAFSFPDMEDGAKAAAAAINDAGGIGGRKIEVTACNDAGDPNQAAACARKAVTGKFTALVGGVSLYYNNVVPTLEKAGIPLIAASPLNTASATSPISFPIESSPAQFAASGVSLVKYKGCKKVAVIYQDNATAVVSGHNVEDGVRSAGGQVVKSVSVPDTTPDYSPVISSALDAGADSIGSALAPPANVKAVTAHRASAKPDPPVSSTVGSVPLVIVKPLGKAAEGIILTNNAFTPDNAVWQKARDAMTRANPKVQIENFGCLAWSAVYTFADVAKTITGDITPKSVAAAAGKQTAVKSIGYPSAVDWTKPGPISGAPRLFQTKALLYEIKNGTYSLVGKDPVDAAPALSASH
jgi:ABC-type branched-subunit amino acid transport system substrate-binding protein